MSILADILLTEYKSLFKAKSNSLTQGIDIANQQDADADFTLSDAPNITTTQTGNATSDKTEANQGEGFQIIGTKVYDPNGQEFIIKGTNVFTWDGTNNIDNYIDTWGFNTIRVPNYLLGGYDQAHPAEDNYATNKAIVEAYTSRGVMVMFDAHDKIGSYYEGEDFETLKTYWRSMAQEFKDNPYVWFNLHNEPGNKTPQHEKWVDYHRELIDIIREEGATNTLVIDGETWGQDYQTETILNKANEVMEGNENVIFSLHIYNQWGDGSEIGGYIDELHNKEIPVLIGEFGDTDATANMMTALQEREVGRINWVAMAADSHDLTTGNEGHAWHFDGMNQNVLTDFGAIVYNDMQRPEELESLELEAVLEYSKRQNKIFARAEAILTESLEANRVDVNNTDQTVFANGVYTTTLSKKSEGILGLDGEKDVIYGRKNADILSGLAGNDTLYGGRGRDLLLGGEGNDTIDGGRGKDMLFGGLGNDILIGGKGRDHFLLGEDGSVDTIVDFQSSIDTILLSQGMTADLLSYSQGIGEQSADTLIFDENNELFGILENFDVNRLKESDFRTI